MTVKLAGLLAVAMFVPACVQSGADVKSIRAGVVGAICPA
jgi:hypothetical protein